MSEPGVALKAGSRKAGPTKAVRSASRPSARPDVEAATPAYMLSRLSSSAPAAGASPRLQRSPADTGGSAGRGSGHAPASAQYPGQKTPEAESLLQAQPIEEEEEPVQARAVDGVLQPQPEEEEEEEPVQARAADGVLQAQPMEEEEELLQPKAPGSASPSPVQAKLTVGRPDDEYEREADAVADRVMRTPVTAMPAVQRHEQPGLRRAPDVQALCSECAAELEEQATGGAPPVQARPSGAAAPQVGAGLQRTVQSPGSGSPLPASVRARIEPILGSDLGHVRVHADSRANQAAGSIGAKAFTHGPNVWLGSGQSSHDLSLMAHESTHVVQQGHGAPVSASIQAACACRTRSDTTDTIRPRLEVNATRHFEPEATFAAVSPGAGGAAAEAVGAGAAEAEGEAAAGAATEGTGEPGDALAAAEASEGGQSGAEGGGEGEGPEAGGGGERACEGGGGGINATCYREGYDEPEEEPDEEPEEPEPTESREEMDSDSPEAEESDDCPLEEAVESQAESAGPAPTAATMSAESGPPAPEQVGSGEAEAEQQVGPETQAMTDAAADSETQAAAAEAPIEAAIARTEGQRGEAVVAYQAAGQRLQAAMDSMNRMGAGQVFAPSGAADGLIRSREELAELRARDFFTGAVEIVRQAGSFALEEVPARIGARAEGVKADIAAATAAARAEITARVATARAVAVAQAEQSREQVNAEHNNTVALIEAATWEAMETVRAEHEASIPRIDEQETAGLDEVSRLYAESRSAHEALGPTMGAEAVARGEEYATRYERCKINRPDGFWAGHLTDRRAEAQQKAAREVAKGYRDNLDKAARDQAREAMKGRKKDRCGVIAAARRARGALDDQLDALLPAMEQGMEQAIASAGASRDQLLASIDGSLRATLKTLQSQEHSQRQAANDTGYLLQVAVEQAAHAAVASLQTAVAAAMDSVQAALASIQDALAGTEAPDPEQLERVLSNGLQAVRAGIQTLETQMQGGSDRALASLDNSGAGARQAIRGVVSSNDEQAGGVSEGFVSSMVELRGGASESFARQAGQYQEQVQGTAANGVAGFQQAVTAFGESVTAITGNVDSSLSDSESKLEESLRNSLKGMDCEATGIPKQAREAASKEQPAWKSVVAVILIIAVIVVVALVIGPAVIGAVGAAASALGAGAAAATIGTIVGGAIVGALASATIQVINNWSSGQDLLQGVGKAAIMGAIGGAFGAGAGALIGKYVTGAVAQFALNIAADAVLELGTALVTGEFSWEAFGMAMLMSLVTGGFGEVGGVKRIQAGMQHRGARMVPGTRARAHAASIKPPSAPETGAGGGRAAAGPEAPTRPAAEVEAGGRRPAAEAEPGRRPAPAEAEPGATRTGEAESRGGPREAEAEAAATGTPAARRRVEAEPDAPAKRMSDAELREATATPTRVGNEDHVVSFRRSGDSVDCEVCSPGCGTVKGKIREMLDGLPPSHELRPKLEALRAKVEAAEARVKRGEANREVIKEAADIAAAFREVGNASPSLGRALDEPSLFAKGAAGTRGEPSGYLKDLDVDINGPVQRVTPGKADDLQVSPGDNIVYVLRDRSSGAVLKVGITEAGPAGSRASTGFSQYANAGNKLGLDLELEVARVTPRGDAKLKTVETQLRERLTAEGNIMPWDNSGGRLGRGDRGTPFVNPVSKELRWDRHGNLVNRNTGEQVDVGRSVRRDARSNPEELAGLIRQGLSNAQIARLKGVHPSTVSKWRKNWAAMLAEHL
jgi:hypothetical protein